MQAGTAISGIGHLGLVVWMMIGGVFQAEPEPPQISDVALVSAEEYAALKAPQAAPDASDAVPGLIEPETPEQQALPQTSEDATPDRQDPSPPEPPDPTPEPPVAPEPPSPPEPEIAQTPPDIAPPDPPADDVAALVPEAASRPETRPVDREASVPAPPQPPDARPDSVTEAPVAPEGLDAEAPEADTAAAPQEATDQPPDPETDPEVESSTIAPTASVRPLTRPDRPTPPQPTEEPTQTAQPAEPAAEDTDTGRNQAVDDAVAAALGQAGAPSSAPTGPPLTGGEREALRVAVSQCWSVGSLSSAALETTVVAGVSMTPDGRPVTNSIRLLSWSDGTEAAAQQAFGAARRAIIRCGQQGYPLPADKYEQWREIEMTFNPEKMQYR
ncbi:MAG: energy transducer TonB [Pseudomonadota bacterium]